MVLIIKIMPLESCVFSAIIAILTRHCLAPKVGKIARTAQLLMVVEAKKVFSNPILQMVVLILIVFL